MEGLFARFSGTLERYPCLRVVLSSTDREVDLIRDGLIASSGWRRHRAALVTRPLGVLEMVNCAAPAYLDRHGTPNSVDELERHFAVLYASPTTSRVSTGILETSDGVEKSHCDRE